ncbi:hypothetical protein PSm6_37430 [Pseudomonas solani]|uniref:Uncharacterized protein n=1 Tax=Pseudomonas solani TaxID=2731552 RepID=A0ABM7LCL8_9PSED|nr:hypothetical protein PSm6_37430 [Pseudomonas solani]
MDKEPHDGNEEQRNAECHQPRSTYITQEIKIIKQTGPYQVDPDKWRLIKNITSEIENFAHIENL